MNWAKAFADICCTAIIVMGMVGFTITCFESWPEVTLFLIALRYGKDHKSESEEAMKDGK